MEAVYFDACFLRKKYTLFTLWLANKAFKYTRDRYYTAVGLDASLRSDKTASRVKMNGFAALDPVILQVMLRIINL